MNSESNLGGLRKWQIDALIRNKKINDKRN